MSGSVRLPEDEQLFDETSGFPRLNAASIATWLQDHVSADNQRSAVYGLSRRWLNRLAGAMNVPHAISESTHFLLLSVPKVDQIKRVLRFLEEARTRVLTALASAQPPADRPKHVVVIFGEKDDYDHFTAAAYPEHERELANTGGMFMSDGVPHILLPSADLLAIHATLVHELVHDCVSHLAMPAWLNEGITQMLEYDVVSWSPFHLDRETMEKHAGHWNEESIQDFWCGRSFHLPGDGQMLSYNLAVVLVRKILTTFAPGREAFWKFVREAKVSDAGEDSLRMHVGLSLDELVADFLGPGNWLPRGDQKEM